MHAGQLEVSVATVRALVAAQFPQWAGLPVRPVTSAGTVNAIFRVGDAVAVRLPLVPGDVTAARRRLEGEAAAARELLGRTRFATPQPLGTGGPGAGYPMPWSAQSWLPGTPADAEDREGRQGSADPAASTAFAHDLAALVRDLRAVDTRGRTFAGDGRGGDLRRHDAWLETCFRESEGLLDVPRLRRLWSELRTVPRVAPDVMSHGDLVPGNVLVTGGRLTGVLDVGGFGPADPALDLVAAWHLLDDVPRRALRDALGSDDLEWSRGMAWAFEQAMGLVWYYARSNPAMARTGRRTLHRILAARYG